jgi:hypothetical protein
MFITTSRAFSLWLDTTCLLYIILVTFSFLIMGGGEWSAVMYIVRILYYEAYVAAFLGIFTVA